MTARNELAPIDETVIPIDLHRAYQDARNLGTAPFSLVGSIRLKQRDEWLSNVLTKANLLGTSLRKYYAGQANLTPTLITEFAGLGQRVWDFEIYAPSRHEWTPLFARQVLDEFCVAIGHESLEDRSPSADYFTDQNSTLFSPHALKRNIARVEKHLRSLRFPNEKQILSDLKSEACMAARRRPPESRWRIQFDEDTKRVIIDGKPFSVAHPTAFELFKAIAAARPDRTTYAAIDPDIFTASALSAFGLLSSTPQQSDGDGPVTPDCRSFRLHGAVWTFTPSQAAVIKAFWDALQRGANELAIDAALEAANVNSRTLRDVFNSRGGKMHPAWPHLFRGGSMKGLKILNVRA